MKKNTKYNHLIRLAVIFACLLLLNKLDILDLTPLIDKNGSAQFNLITVNSIFAGFLFTSITFFTGITTTKTIEIFERINYMDKVYGDINTGFISSVTSIVFSLISIFIVPSLLQNELIHNSGVLNYLLRVINPLLIITFMIYTILQFIISIKHLNFIIKSIRRKSIKNVPTPESIEETLKEIK